MPRVNRARLLALSSREFSKESAVPVPVPANRKFRPVPLKLARYDASWDRKRGAAARMMAVVLRESDEQLTARVCASPQSSTTYRGAKEWLASEAQALRKHVRHLESATSRLMVVLQRCGADERSMKGTASPSP